MICRHCNCPRALGTNACVNVLKVPVSVKSGDMQVSKHQNGKEYQSYLDVHNGNTFYDIDFGENPHNIHLASPGERLHMHQLANKEGNQYIAMLNIQMLSLLPAEGCQLFLSPRTTTNLENKSRKCGEKIDRRIYAKELLLGTEEFLKYAGMFDKVFKEDKKDVLNLDKMVVLFINYSAASESNHKTEVKAHAKRTQQIKSTLIKQACNTEGGWSAGFKFLIGVMDGLPYMKCDSKNASVPWFPSDVLKFCCNVVLPAVGTSTLRGSTEHQRYDNYNLLHGRGLQVYPCQILCLLYLEGPFPLGSSISSFKLVHSGYYAREKGGKHRHVLVKQGELRNKLYLFDCNVIESEAAIIRNHGSHDQYFVLGNLEQWLFHFCETMAALEQKNIESIV
eukprot:jgi/Psemu1/40179/gm1.40179_g